MDWKQIELEYVTNSSASYRFLAEKFGVSVSAISKHAKAGDWKKGREQFAKKSNTKTVNNLAEKNAKTAARRMAKMQSVADRLLNKLDKAVKLCDAEKFLENPKLIRGLTGALLDLRQVLDVRHELDLKEQEARINKLARDAQQGGGSVTVTMEEGMQEFAE